MSPVHIKTRVTKSGKRYLVYYRLGGREHSMRYAGTFKRKSDATTRRDLVGGWIAAGLDPRVELAKLKTPAVLARLDERWDGFDASRVDVGDKAHRLYRNAKTWWIEILGADRDPASIRPADIQTGIATMTTGKLSPGTVAQYVSTLRQVLDFCDVEPNPARSPKVKLPTIQSEEVNPPSSSEWSRIRAQVKTRSLLVLRLIECCGLRVSEATDLQWGDVDLHEGQLRISKARTKTASGQRWIAVPDEFLDELADLCPLEDRTADRQVFPTLTHDAVRRDLASACTAAGTAAYHPHDLRHRRISLWLRHKIDAVTVAQWAGHARASMSLDVYGHVTLDPREDEWRIFWRAVYDRTREAPVRHGDSA